MVMVTWTRTWTGTRTGTRALTWTRVMRDIEIIEMNPRETDCHLCGARCWLHFALPMYEGVVVPDDYEGEWGGMNVCESCYRKHRGQTQRGEGASNETLSTGG